MATIDPASIADPTSTTPANSEEAPKDTSGLPEEILAMPIFAGILQGSPAAVWTPTGDKSKEATTAVRFGKELNSAGLYFLRDSKEKIDLLYNALEISPATIEAAQKAGKLKEIASPLTEVNAAFSGAVSGAGAPAGAAPAMTGPSGVSDSPLNTARRENLLPGSPTSGNYPGSGRILNEISKNAI